MTRLHWVSILFPICLAVGCQDANGPATTTPAATEEATSPDLPSPNSVDIALTDPTEQEPVSWGAALDRSSLGSGDVALLVVRAKILDGWHIYAAKGDTGVGKPTKLQLTLPNGLSEGGEWALPLAEVKNSSLGQINHHKKLASFSIPIKVANGTTAQEANIVCDVNFQSCTDTGCLPPTSKQLTVPVTLTE